MPGFPDWMGTPLLHGVEILHTVTGSVILNSATATFENQISRPGYQLTMSASGSAASTVPFFILQVQFWDSTFTTFIDETDWIVPVDISAGVTHVLRGPVRGQGIKINVQNLEPAHSVTLNLTLSQTTHHIARDDMRVANVQANTVMAVYTLWADAYPQNANLGSGTVSVPATTTLKFLDFIYAGEIQYSYNGSGTTQVLQLRIPDALPASVGGNSLIWSDTLNASPFSHLLVAPRCPVMVTLNNPSAGPLTVNFGAYALEYAS